VNVCSAKFIPTSRRSITKDDHLDELTNYLITATGKQDLLIAPNIYLHIEKGPTPDPKVHIFSNNFFGVLHYKVILYSYKLRLKQLKASLTEWTVTYRDYVKEKTKGESFLDRYHKD
jgi:hypothetical protein